MHTKKRKKWYIPQLQFMLHIGKNLWAELSDVDVDRRGY